MPTTTRTYDLKISNALLYDGSGASAVQGELGISDGRITAVGAHPAAQPKSSRRRSGGCGFIDIHTHYDAQVIWDRMLTISPWHGVTSVVMGNCGFSVAPTRAAHRDIIIRTLENVEGMTAAALEAGLGREWPFETFPEYLDALATRGTAINVGALIGHTALRTYVLGEDATEREAGGRSSDDAPSRRRGDGGRRARLRDLKALTHVGYRAEAGAEPGGAPRILALAGGLADAARGGIVQATIGPELAFDEFAAINRATGRPVSWTALLAGAALTDEDAAAMLARSEALQQRGYAVVPQVTPRPLNFEFQLEAPFIFEAMRMFRRCRADHEGKTRLQTSFAPGSGNDSTARRRPCSQRFRGTTITDVPGRPELMSAIC